MMLVEGFKHSNKSDLYSGQEVLCPDGLGVISKINEVNNIYSTITVNTYENNRCCNWDVINILVKE